MKRVLISLGLAAVLTMAMAVPAMAASSPSEGSAAASVTVNEYVNITLADQGATGITFGSVDQGSTDNPDQLGSGYDFSSLGSVVVGAGSETNCTVTLQLKNNDWVATTWTADYSKYGTTSNPDNNRDMSGGYEDVLDNDGEAVTLTGGESQTLWHWLDVPAVVDAGSHGNTFSYRVVA